MSVTVTFEPLCFPALRRKTAVHTLTLTTTKGEERPRFRHHTVSPLKACVLGIENLLKTKRELT